MLKNNNIKIEINNLNISDFKSLHAMIDSLDDNKSRQYIDLYWLGFRKVSLKWLLAQFPLFASTIGFLKRIMFLIYPYIIFVSEVAKVNSKVISFGFLIIRKPAGRKLFHRLQAKTTDFSPWMKRRPARRFGGDSATTKTETPHFSAGRTSFLAELGIVVADDYQSIGIGTEILKKLINRAKSESIKEIYLTTRIDNTKAHNFYKKMGFKDTAILKNQVEWQGKKFDMYKMLLKL